MADSKPRIAASRAELKPDIAKLSAASAVDRKPKIKKRKKRKKRKKKDLNAPPRPLPAFIRFSQARRQQVVHDNPNASFGMIT